MLRKCRTRPGDLSKRRRRDHRRQLAGAHLRGDGNAIGEDASVHGRRQHERARLIQGLDVTAVPRERGDLRHLRETDAVVRFDDVADLLPGGIHVPLVVLLYDARAETGSYPEPRIEIEAMDPIVIVREPRAIARFE